MRTFIFPACLVLALFGNNCPAQNDDELPATTQADSISIQLDSKAQQLAGIQTQALEAAEQQAEITVYGNVLSLEPLLQMRQQYLAAQAQQQGDQAKYREAQLNLARTQSLHSQDIVSTRRLQEHQAQSQTNKAALSSSGYQQQSLLAASRLQWGSVLTDWFTQANGKAAEALINQQAQIVQISLPANLHLNPQIRSIAIDERGQRAHAIQASLVSASPQVDPLTQGERYFFKSSGRILPFGAHITAWLAGEQQASSGVNIPETALVWHLGQAFVFIKTADDQFSRRELPTVTPSSHGYFAAAGSLQPGEKVVSKGAQTLLSQQLKNLIPNEDND